MHEQFALLALLIHIFSTVQAAPAPDSSPLEVGKFYPDKGVFLGPLPNLADGDVSGRVFVINETALQIFNFTYNGNAPDLYFWLGREEKPSRNGVKIPTFEFGITPLGPYENAKRVVLILTGTDKISHFKSFSLFCYRYEHTFANVAIPENIIYPKPQILDGVLRGSRYNVGSGSIIILNRRTIKVLTFTFDGDKAPDGYFFVGRGPIAHDAGVKVPILGRDTPELITAMNERYRGGQDIVLTLPEEYDIDHIEWLSIYCYKFRVDFGSVTISNISQRIPPYIPLQKRFDEIDNTKDEKWNVTALLGSDNRLNFTMQLGPPGGKKGYLGLTKARPGKHVWYVNGYMTELYLRRGVTYTFIVEGGEDKSTPDLYNPFYISDDRYGGYSRLSDFEQQQVRIYAGGKEGTAGRLCLWAADEGTNPDKLHTFIDYRYTMELKCEKEKAPAIVRFTPNDTTPDTLYFNSFTSFNMGNKIHVVSELPNIPDWVEEPYDYEHWKSQKQAQTGLSASTSTLCSTFVAILSLCALLW